MRSGSVPGTPSSKQPPHVSRGTSRDHGTGAAPRSTPPPAPQAAPHAPHAPHAPQAAPKDEAVEVTRTVSTPSSAKRRDPLLSAICHDLRAPLAAVTMGANFVLQTTTREGKSPRAVKILEAMLRSCGQMERLIRNFADLSEIEAGTVTLRLGLHDVGEMLELAADAVSDLARARSILVHVRKPEISVAVRCDRERVVRSLGHVVENAVAVAPEGSTVTLEMSFRDDTVALAITDRGPGLTADVRKNLFDRHWHAQRASRVGAGFGLAITRGFMEAHGGRLLVDSRQDEETTFTLCIPKEGPPAES